MIEIRYCLNGCTHRQGNGSIRATTEGKSRLCTRCEDRLHRWVGKIPDAYALVPLFIEHASIDANPEGTVSKRTDGAAPMRLDPIDILDTRRGRIWNGTEPTVDRRGVIGVLQPWVDIIRDERSLTTIKAISVSSACGVFKRHLLWIAEQEWVPDFYEDMKTLNRTLSDAIGEYRQKPVGRCTNLLEEKEEPCGGPLFSQATGGVTCARCQDHTAEDHLRILGAALQAGPA